MLTAGLIAAAGLLYGTGFVRLRRRAEGSRALLDRRALLFATGWILVGLALLSPLDTLARSSFAAHMVEHEILMAAAAPLLVLAEPLPAILFALPTAWRRRLGGLAGSRWLRRFGILLAGPAAAWALHTLALWVWHAPALFDAALASEGTHVLQHASFVAAALIYWRSVLRARGERSGAAVLSLFATTLAVSALGALLTFSTVPWYAAYRLGEAGAVLTPIEDQQLAGLIMWIPGCLAYLVAALALAALWLRDADAHARAWEARPVERSLEA